MPVEKAKPDFYAQLTAVCENMRPDVDEIKLKIGVVFHHAAVNEHGIKTGPGLSKGGHEVAWTAKVTSPDERLTGSPDLRVKLNGDLWDEMEVPQRDALLDEVLYAITIVRDPDSDLPLTDDALRPRIRLKPFDIYVQGYETIVRRHGEASICYAQLSQVTHKLSQQTLFTP